MKRINQYSRALALGNFLERLGHHKRIEPKSILVNAPIFQSQRRRLAVGNHHNLPHVFLLPRQNPLRQPKPFARIGVIRTNLHARQIS